MQADRDKELTKNYKTHIFLQMAMSNKHFYDIQLQILKFFVANPNKVNEGSKPK